MTDTAGLFGFGLACFLAATTGGIFRPGEWYERLAKPRWRPPNWLFGPAWLVLYSLIAYAAWTVWRQAGFAGAPLAMAAFFVQLLFNAGWSWVFFGLRRPDLAFVELVGLWLSIAAMIASQAGFTSSSERVRSGALNRNLKARLLRPSGSSSPV